MSSGPHQRNIGWRELSINPTTALRLAGHNSTGPRAVFDQSKARAAAPASPPPSSHDDAQCGSASPRSLANDTNANLGSSPLDGQRDVRPRELELAS